MGSDLLFSEVKNHFRILIVDDDEMVLKVIARFLGEHGYRVETTTSGRRAIEKVGSSTYDLVLLDLKLPDMDGLGVLKEIKRVANGTSVLMMTGHGRIETAVQAMKLGADDYLQKPFKSFDALIIAVNRIKEYRDLKDECFFLKEQLSITYNMNTIIGKSKEMMEVFELIKKVAPLNSTVLIEGESGTGKELIARAIHQNSPRAQKRFVAINCGAIPVNLLESELFGYERGAFTGAVQAKRGYFEVADGGTIFLDEISEMDNSLQVKFLRVIQEKRFNRIGGTEEIATDVRIITSTNRDLGHEVDQRRFRKDLYYRINVIKIKVPPLRERREDIPLLSYHFLRKYSQEFEKNVKSISPEVMSVLMRHRWDGNVRELENFIEHSVALADGEEIMSSDLPENLFDLISKGEREILWKPYDEAKRQFEKNYLEQALERAKGNVTQASRLTSIPRQNIYEKIKKYNIDPDRFR